MRPGIHLMASVLLGLVSAVAVTSPGGFDSLVDQFVAVPATALELSALSADSSYALATPAAPFKPIGLTLLRPYSRGKIPAVLIHGLGAVPESWAHMIGCLESNPIIRDHYQIWTFGYASGQPILYSASLLREALVQARRQYDPDKTDKAFDRMVLIGYSMGGILAKVMAEDSRSLLWEKISTKPVEALSGPAEACDVLRRSFLFKAVPEVHRIVFIATPHRGSPVDQGALHWLGARLNQPLDDLRKIYDSLLASNDPEFFHESFRQGLPSSVDQLAWEHPRLMSLFDLGFNPGVTFHSIIADVNDPPSTRGTDGVVSYASAHLDGALSELLVHSGHLCLANSRVIAECERILEENLVAPASANRTDPAGRKPSEIETQSLRGPAGSPRASAPASDHLG